MVAKLIPPPNLDDLGDVSVPTPGDQYLLYWDAATSLWKCRALVDGDIPAAIARDAEVTAAVAAEAAARNAAIAAVKLDDLADVSVPSPTDGYVLYWDAATSLWKAKAVGGSKIVDADADTSWDVEQSADEDKVHGKVKGVEAFLLDDAGVLTLAKQSACRAYRATSAQNIPKTTWTKVQLNAEDFDIQGEFDSTTNYRFTAKTAGIYVGGAAAVISIAADGALLGISIYKNGQAATDNYTTPGATGDAGVGTPFAIQLAVNDYLEMYVYQGSSGSLNLAYGSRLSWFFVAKVS